MMAAVSVIIPCYRCTATIRRAVASVWQQTLRPAEVILVEDGSGDGTLALLQQLHHEYPGWIRLVLQPKNAGPSHARNSGWAAASQPLLAFLDADDAWHPEKLARQYTFMQQHPDVALSGHARRVSLSTENLPDWSLPVRDDVREVGRNWLLKTNRFVTPSIMLRREIPWRFSERQHYMEDHLLWLEIVCSGLRAVYLSSELAAIYKPAFGVSGLSSHLWGMGKQDVLNYWRLYRLGWLSVFEALFWSSYATMKFARRVVLYWGVLKWQK